MLYAWCSNNGDNKMSYVISTDIFCDVCNCAWEFGITGNKERKRAAMKRARLYGYVVYKEDGIIKHRCEKCQEEYLENKKK